jgi:hypothetical protein
MRLTKPLMMLLAAGFVLQTSCIMLDIPWDLGGGYQGEFHRIVSFEPGGTVQLDNPRGDVEIRGWDENRVEITARQEGAQSYGRGEYFRWSLRREPRVAVDTAGGSVTITALGSGRDKTGSAVHFLIYVPRSIDLKDIRIGSGSLIVGDVYGHLSVSLGDGDLTIDNYSGSIQASIGKGSVEAEVLDLRGGDRVAIALDQGDIALILEDDAGAKLEADAGDGRVRSDFDVKAPVGTAKVSALLGDGRAVINLKTSHGNIRLKKSQ